MGVTEYIDPAVRKHPGSRHGGVISMQGKRTRPTREERFWAKVEKTDTCWLWTSTIGFGGYGRFTLARGESCAAHRLSYEWAKGPIPEGLELDHLCRVRNCVNPDHLEAVTHAENVRRARAATAKDYCYRGHEFTPENTLIDRDGWRRCRECRAIRQRAWRARQKGAPVTTPDPKKQPKKPKAATWHPKGQQTLDTGRERAMG